MPSSRKDPLPLGFKSKAQWRMFFARPSLRKWAHKEAHKTQRYKGGPKVAFRALPQHASMAGALGVGKSLRTAKGFKTHNRRGSGRKGK